MKRIYVLYCVLMAVLVVLALAWIGFSQRSNIVAALGGLGKSDAEYQQARQQILYNSNDPAPAVLDLIRNRHKSVRARIQALQLLRELAFRQKIAVYKKPIAPLIREKNRELTLEVLKTLAKVKNLDSAEITAEFFRNIATF